MKLKYLLLGAGLVATCQNPTQKHGSQLNNTIRDGFVNVFKENEGTGSIENKTDESLDLDFSRMQDSFSQRRERILHSIENKVFITLDDGPNKYTREILKMLDSLWQKATFFRVGQNVGEKYKEVAKDLVDAGHELGSHSYAHENFKKYTNLSDARENVEKVETNFAKIGQPRPKYFRYPYGEKVKQDFRSDFSAYLKERWYQNPVFRDIDTRDWDKKVSREKMKETLLKVKPGDIILLHENKRALWETLILIDSILDARSYQSVPVSEKFNED